MRNVDVNNKDSNKGAASLAGLTLAALLLPAAALAHGPGGHSHTETSGEVVVVSQTPNGSVTVGAEWGRRPREVVVVEQRPQVIVVKEETRCPPRRVTVVREEPARQVTVIKEKDRCGNVVKRTVVEERVIHTRRGDYTRVVEVPAYDRGHHGRPVVEEVRYEKRDRGHGRGKHDRDGRWEHKRDDRDHDHHHAKKVKPVLIVSR